MTCDTVASELVGFHLGAVDLVARDAIDAHLIACRACLARYLGVKRSLEDAPLNDASPSSEVRARIRRDVEALVVPRAKVIPLRPAWVVGGLAAAAALFLFAFELGAGHLHPHPRASNAASSGTLIDSEQADTSLKVL